MMARRRMGGLSLIAINGAGGPPAAAEGFTAVKLAWVEAVLASSALTPFQARLGALMGVRYANRAHFLETGRLVAWPSQARLAGEIGGTEDGVRKAVRGLRDHGFVEVLRAGGGRGVNALYHLTSSSQSIPTAPDICGQEGGVTIEGFAGKPQTGIPKTPDGEPMKPQTATGPTFLRNSLEHAQQHARGPNAWDQLVSILPERMLRISNLRRAQDLWGPAVVAFGADRLLAAARAYAGDPAIRKQTHLPAMQTWLRERLFVQFLPAAASARTPHAVHWSGPADLREAVVAACGEPFAVSYFDRATWDADRRLITPRTAVARDQLRKAATLWAKWRVEIGEPARASP